MNVQAHKISWGLILLVAEAHNQSYISFSAFSVPLIEIKFWL